MFLSHLVVEKFCLPSDKNCRAAIRSPKRLYCAVQLYFDFQLELVCKNKVTLYQIKQSTTESDLFPITKTNLNISILFKLLHEWIVNTNHGKAHFYAVEDRIPRVHPWMNELYLVSALAEVRSAPQEPSTFKDPGLARGYLLFK